MRKKRLMFLNWNLPLVDLLLPWNLQSTIFWSTVLVYKFTTFWSFQLSSFSTSKFGPTSTSKYLSNKIYLLSMTKNKENYNCYQNCNNSIKKSIIAKLSPSSKSKPSQPNPEKYQDRLELDWVGRDCQTKPGKPNQTKLIN